MHIPEHSGRRRISARVVAAASAVAIGSLALAGAVGPGMAFAARSGPARQAAAVQDNNSVCQLGNGVQHVVQLTFDNVHFFRDNPNVPSDLQMMPNLLQFFQNNGTWMSNNHTPLIAHTGVDILTTNTGLYGDRHGMPVSNSYRTFNPNGTTDPAGSFAYWTDPVFDTAATPTAGHDANPSMVYAAQPPATAKNPPAPTTVTPAPWVPFTRAGCDVGDIATANQELENTAVDLPKVFGPNSAEVAQLNADGDRFKDPEVADYVGLGVHCAQGSGGQFCSSAQAVKFGQTDPSASAVSDVLPNEPGGYNNFQALFGHRYIAPQLGAGAADLSHNGYQVTNAAGNLVDLNGNQINGAFLTDHPGFPGFSSINASQTLAYMSDMLETGIPVVNGYISDIHGNEHIAGVTACNGAPAALGPGSACYIAQAQYYNQAFAAFFTRLAADGITPQNSLFVISADEGDHVAGANVGRAIQPTPANCDGATVSGTTVTPDVLCTYPPGTFGELAGNLPGLLATQRNNTTPFTLEADSAPEFYVTGNPGPTDPAVRTLERDAGALTANNPYTGTNQLITNYLADPTEEAILHMVNADPARTPTFAMFARPDYFLTSGATNCNSPCVSVNPSFAYNHGDYSADIDTTFLGLAGPGVKNLGLDGSQPADGPNSAGIDSGQVTVPGSSTTGTWIDQTDMRPTILYLAGLRDDYKPDGRVITQVLTDPNHALSQSGVAQLGACYKQLNSSVGEFGTDTLIASTAGLKSNSPGDKTYLKVEHALSVLGAARDKLATQIKGELEEAAFGDATIQGTGGQIVACNALLGEAHALASDS
jgi:hypothetical protein